MDNWFLMIIIYYSLIIKIIITINTLIIKANKNIE